MIQFDAVSKRYGPPRRAVSTVYALRDVTLEVPRGATWAVVGPNGAGKTTLFGLLLGFLNPTAGTIDLGGDEPRRYVRRHGAAYLPERFSVPGNWPVREALRGFARIEKLGGGATRAADDAVERFGLAAYADKRFAELSHGLRQRVGVAQAFLAHRDIAVLDEPTEGLDPLWRIHLRDAVADLQARGTTVLLASHDLAEVERLAAKVIVLDRGAVREMFDTRSRENPRRYALRVVAGADHVNRAFPSAIPVSAEGGAVFHVEVLDASELSSRLEALLAAGGVVAEVHALAEPLETRVRRALGERDA